MVEGLVGVEAGSVEVEEDLGGEGDSAVVGEDLEGEGGCCIRSVSYVRR